MLTWDHMQKQLLRGNELLVLLIDVVIDTHNYEDMTDFRKRLNTLREGHSEEKT